MRGFPNLNTRTVSLLLVATLCLSEGTHVCHSLYHPTTCEKVKMLISDLGKVKSSNDSDVTVPIFRQFVRAESQHLSRLSRRALLGGSRFTLTRTSLTPRAHHPGSRSATVDPQLGCALEVRIEVLLALVRHDWHRR